jgi:pimeloyl-ACP methyl ester carboxylesterase
MTDDTDAQARELLEMMRTPKRRVRPRLAEPLRDAEDVRVETPVGPVAAWRVGDGPAVLLVHGWEDDNALWGPLLEQLWAVGRSAVVLDLPGHGFSEAEMAGPEGAADALLAVAEQVGPVDAVVGHSFGCPVSILAMKRGLPARRAAMLAAAIPARRGWLDRLADRGVPEAVLTRMGELMGPIYDVEADGPAMTAEALFLHSLDDDATPVENAETLAALWPGARLSLTDGLGHRLIAQDAAVLQQVVEFVG